MLVVSEKLARELVSIEDAIAVVGGAFAAAYAGKARSYPVVRELVGHADAIFGVKSGYDGSLPVLGLKAGGYWPGNAAKGLSNHQSVVLLFDQETGQAIAVVSANYLTGVRTGAASALATRHLARADASVLGMIGTGVQSLYQLLATSAARPIARVLAWDPNEAGLAAFGKAVKARGLAFEAPGIEAVARQADILITVTPSRSALVRREWIRPGTHINAMGADTAGKQELDPALVAEATMIVDDVEQAISIGECQHAYRLGLVSRDKLRWTLGAVVAGAFGRKSASEITLFDGTGIALQDLAVAALAWRRAVERGQGQDCAPQ
ncbi:MAG TPA: ornithine cyclodeaminase family protein [Candidatus Bathyarchaeia archaeon]|nr:ornithine cyclodeaminase family protein [Candidatus Bathyarchaeia archaeon]